VSDEAVAQDVPDVQQVIPWHQLDQIVGLDKHPIQFPIWRPWM